MDELEIKIVLPYKLPKTGLTLNGILRGLEQDKNILMRAVVKTIVQALGEKAIEEEKIEDDLAGNNQAKDPCPESLG